MNYIKTHLLYIILIAIGLVGFRSWLQEHDAKLQAQAQEKVSEATVKSAEDRIQSLAQDIEKIRADRDSTIAALVKQRQVVKTPQQAIAAIPDLSTLPLNTRPTEDPNRVTVDVMPLFQQLNSCRQDTVARAACEAESGKKDDQLKEKTTQLVAKNEEIKALKAKPKFWKRVWGHVKDQAIGVAGGIIIKAVFL